ncbi:MAG TPA: DUF6580 family putative transport protein [Candidatus Eisenbacteria bacterium]|nr:DUF6580 family putative transport protein [Candidatus Eisenbacteria bacterium]
MKNIVAIGIIIGSAVLLRLVPHVPNFAPIGAMALFGGTYLSKKNAFFLPLAVMILSDSFLGFSASTPSVYASFILTVGIGIWLKNHKSVQNIILSSLISSTIFYFLTNFNFWYPKALYSRTFSGMIDSYVMALPFFRPTVFGDLFYTGLFFGGYELMQYAVRIKQYAIRKHNS